MEDIQSNAQRDKKMNITYTNVGSIYSELQRNKPLSCVKIFADGHYFMVKDITTKNVQGFPVSFQYLKIINTLSMVYHNVVVDMSKTDDRLCNVDTTTISNYLLLLPELGEHGYITIDIPSVYYIIDSQWNKLDQYYTVEDPNITRMLLLDK